MYMYVYVYMYMYMCMYMYMYMYVRRRARKMGRLVSLSNFGLSDVHATFDLQVHRRGTSLLDAPNGSMLRWVFITGGCSGSGVQWMRVVLYNKLVYNSIQITTPCFHCTPL